MPEKAHKNRFNFIKVLIALILANSFVVSNRFVNQINTPREFYFFFLVAGLVVITMYLKTKQKEGHTIRINLPDLLLVGYMGYVTINASIKNSFILNTELFINHIMLFIFYFCCRWLVKNKIITVPFIFRVLLLIALIELAWAYLQYFGYVKSYHADFKITGSFENPGPMTTFLSVLLPVCIMLFYMGRSKVWIRSFLLLVSLLIILLLILSHQRASWIGGLSGIIMVLILQYRQSFLKWLKKPLLAYPALTLLLVGVVFSGIFLYKHKLESSQGRVFIWKNCIELAVDKPLFGHGFENYLITMNDKQADYFMRHPEDMDNALRVTNIEFAFNDHLQMMVESGILGFLLFIAFIFFSIRKVFKSIRESFVIASIISIIVILIMALFTYPFHTLSVQVLFYIFMAIINASSEYGKSYKVSINPAFLKASFYLIAGLAVFTGAIQAKRLNAQKRWKELAFEIRENKDIKRIFGEYEDLMPVLGYDRYFLYNYAAELSLRGCYKESLWVFNKALVKINDSDTYLYLGNSYENTGQSEKAERCYRQAMNLIPHRFYPRYRLVTLWLSQGRKEEALQMAYIMLSMPVKVESNVVNNILDEMRAIYIDNLPVPREVLTEQLRFTLQTSGNRMSEFLNILEHYSQNPSDSLKLKAAVFLIENMYGHYSAKSDFNIIYSRYLKDMPASRAERYVIWDSIRPLLKELPPTTNQYDLLNMDALYIIRNIDDAFATWDKVPWNKDYSFDQFYHYVLPYRVCNEPLENWREYFKTKYHDIWDSIMNGLSVETAYAMIDNSVDTTHIIVGNFPYAYDMSPTAFYEGHIGSCRQVTLMMVLIMRSMGIPAVFDYTPAWANRAKGHDWTALIDPDENPMLILENEAIPRDYNRVHSSRLSREKSLLLLKDELKENRIQNLLKQSVLGHTVVNPDLLLEKTPVYPEKKVAKVYRHTYEIDPISTTYLNTLQGKGIKPFDDYHMKDVTGQYMDQPNGVRLQLWQPDHRMEYAYVGVFNREQHIFPVARAKKEDKNIITLRNLGIEILYFPVYIENNNLLVAGAPFVLEKEGNIRFIEPDVSKRQTIVVKRKYPLFINILYHAQTLYSGKIQAANRLDFSDAEDIMDISYTPLYDSYIPVKCTKPYRYLRFVFYEKSDISLAELGAFSPDDEGNGISLNGKPMGEPGDENQPASKAFDNDTETYTFKSGVSDVGWIGLDFGKEYIISKVRLCPRNDSNGIMAGKTYELFFWNNSWVSAGVKKAETDSLVYKDVPSETLYWVKCLDGGTEERPFTYEEGKQVWW